MSQNVTETPRENELSPQQIRALECLLKGRTVTEAAKDAKVSRETVSRWKQHDVNFILALKHGKRELLEAMQLRIQNLAYYAVDTVHRMVDTKEAYGLSVELLKDMGIFHRRLPEILSGDEIMAKEIAEFEVRQKREISPKSVENGKPEK